MRHVEISLTELAFQAEAGDRDSQYRMGVLFLLGESVEQDLNAAHLWMARAAAGQHKGAQTLLEKLANHPHNHSCNVKPMQISITAHKVWLSFSTIAIRISSAAIHATQFVFAGLRTSWMKGLTAKVRLQQRGAATDFPPRRSESFQFPEAS